MGARTAVPVTIAVWIGLLLGFQLGSHDGRASSAHGIAGIAVALFVVTLAARVVSRWKRSARRDGRDAPDRIPPRGNGLALHDLAMLVALAASGMARAAALDEVLARQRAALPAGLCRIEARLVDPPLEESGAPSVTAQVIASRPPLVPGTRLRLWLPEGSRAEWGDRITSWVRLDPPGPIRDPGGIDSRGAARSAAIAAWGRAFTCAVTDSSGVARATAARWRRAIEAVYAARLTPAAREIVTPLVIGDRSALSSELDAAFRAAGVIHLLALSGLHVTWMAGVARGLCAALGLGVRARAVAGALCAVFYAALAGPLPSLGRAVATECAVGVARLARRPLDPVQALALSALAALLVAPGWASDLGFQLSCGATLGLLTVGAALAQRAGRLKHALAPFLPTASAQLAALPLLLARLHVVSWVAPLTNLIAVPISGLLMAAAWLGAVWDLALPRTARPVFAACEALSAAFRAVTEAGARLPGAAWATGADPAVAWVAAAAAILLIAAIALGRDPTQRGESPARESCEVIGLALLIAALLEAAVAAPLAPAPGRCWLVTLDVGQGDGIALGTPAGWWLIDSGPRTPRSDAGERVVLPFLRWAGVRGLLGVVLTHDDSDHTGGAPALRRGIHVGAWLAPPSRPDAPGPGPRFGARSVARGDTLASFPLIRVLWPPDSIRTQSGLSDNTTGVVIEVACDTVRALLLADVDTTCERRLALRPQAVLKLGHHGSRSSTSPDLLRVTRPALALISCGRWNHFGHPHPEVLERLRAAGVPWRRTDREGALWLELSGAGVSEIDWRRGPAALRQEAASPARAAPPRD